MRSLLAVVGTALVIVPASAFDPVVDSEWEVGIIRLAGPVLVAIAGVWAWVFQTRGPAVAAFNRWVLPGLGLLAIYFLSRQTMFLIFGFSVLFAGAANLWVLRAYLASESLWQSLGGRPNR